LHGRFSEGPVGVASVIFAASARASATGFPLTVKRALAPVPSVTRKLIWYRPSARGGPLALAPLALRPNPRAWRRGDPLCDRSSLHAWSSAARLPIAEQRPDPGPRPTRSMHRSGRGRPPVDEVRQPVVIRAGRSGVLGRGRGADRRGQGVDVPLEFALKEAATPSDVHGPQRAVPQQGVDGRAAAPLPREAR
jgi:hypothetical protein